MNNSFDGITDHIPEDYSDYAKQQIRKVVDDVTLKENIKKELKTTAKYQEYFSRFNPASIDAFINWYANDKYLYLTYADMYKREAENALLGFYSKAEERLWHIQQKKLFDLQCLWRAGQITLPGVELTFDFRYWGSNIRNCPFLPPITEDEVLLYIRYLHQCETREDDYWYDWQDYERIASAYKLGEHEDESGDIPEWYQFCNVYTGNTQLMALPDLRGEKEDFYRKIYFAHKEQHEQETGAQPLTRPGSLLPYLDCNDIRQVEQFIRTCESKKDLELYRNYIAFHHRQEDSEELEYALEILQKAQGEVPIEAGSNWKESVIRAAVRYENGQIAQAIRQVYDDYLFKQQAGIGYEEDDNFHTRHLKEIAREQILKGRSIAGEPADLNF